MRCNTNGANAGTAAAVGNAECFVQVEMADIRAEISGPAEAHLGIHVGSVHVNLAPVGVNEFTNFADALLKNSVRTRIRHHERCQVGGVLVHLGAQIIEIDVPL